MSEFGRIPGPLLQCMMEPYYYITYYGEIYHGFLAELPEYNDGFYIIPKHKLLEFNALQKDTSNFENYRKLGTEIKDYRIIKEIIHSGFIDNNVLGHDGYPTVNPTSKLGNRMFIFGAGASSFCNFGDTKELFDTTPLKPPTGYELFNEKYKDIISRYQAVMVSIPEFESSGNDIELCLEKDLVHYKTTYNPLLVVRHINIQFYLQELFLAISNEVITNFYRNNLYNLFALKIQKCMASKPNELCAFVSFNYDTILENFLVKAFGLTYSNLNDYIDWNNNPFAIFKPHGSANWGWKFDNRKINLTNSKPLHQFLYDSKIEPWKIFFNLLGDIKTMTNQSSFSYDNNIIPSNTSRFSLNKQRIEIIPEQSEDQYYPAMLLPYKDKDEFIMPYNHQLALELAFSKIEDLFLIGWKGSEDLFNRKLQQHATMLKRIIIVNPDADAVKSNLSKFIDLNHVEIEHINDFEEFVLHHLDNYLI